MVTWSPKSPSVSVPWDSTHVQGPEEGARDKSFREGKNGWENIGRVYSAHCGDGRSKSKRQLIHQILEKGVQVVDIVFNFLLGEHTPHAGTSTKDVRRAPGLNPSVLYISAPTASCRPLACQFA